MDPMQIAQYLQQAGFSPQEIDNFIAPMLQQQQMQPPMEMPQQFASDQMQDPRNPQGIRPAGEGLQADPSAGLYAAMATLPLLAAGAMAPTMAYTGGRAIAGSAVSELPFMLRALGGAARGAAPVAKGLLKYGGAPATGIAVLKKMGII